MIKNKEDDFGDWKNNSIINQWNNSPSNMTVSLSLEIFKSGLDFFPI